MSALGCEEAGKSTDCVGIQDPHISKGLLSYRSTVPTVDSRGIERRPGAFSLPNDGGGASRSDRPRPRPLSKDGQVAPSGVSFALRECDRYSTSANPISPGQPAFAKLAPVFLLYPTFPHWSSSLDFARPARPFEGADPSSAVRRFRRWSSMRAPRLE